MLQGALRDFVLSLARAPAIVIAVDDVERIDEPSAALLAALAHHAERHQLDPAADGRARCAGVAALALIRGLSRADRRSSR